MSCTQWRNVDYPLIDNVITNYQINQYWQNNNDVTFPEDSNCQMCFWKDVQQLRKNFDKNPSIMFWAAIQEYLKDATFKKEMGLIDVKDVGLQLDFNFGTGAENCKSGFCRS